MMIHLSLILSEWIPSSYLAGIYLEFQSETDTPSHTLELGASAQPEIANFYISSSVLNSGGNQTRVRLGLYRLQSTKKIIHYLELLGNCLGSYTYTKPNSEWQL